MKGNEPQRYSLWEFIPNVKRYGFLGALGEDIFATLARHPKWRNIIFNSGEEDITPRTHTKQNYSSKYQTPDAKV